MSSTGIVVANAPISYGAFELTVGTDPTVPDAGLLLDYVGQADYEGIDLGPVGFFGTGDELRSALETRGLGLAGGYLELPFSDPASLDEAMAELDALLDVFEAAPTTHPAPRPTLADAGSLTRRQNPGRSAVDRSFGVRRRRLGPVCRRSPEGRGPLPGTRVRAHAPSRGRHPHRSRLGDRRGAGAHRHRPVSRDRTPAFVRPARGGLSRLKGIISPPCWEVLYIEQSSDVSDRAGGYLRQTEARNLGATLVMVRWMPGSSEEERLDIEGMLIKAHDPALNKRPEKDPMSAVLGLPW